MATIYETSLTRTGTSTQPISWGLLRTTQSFDGYMDMNSFKLVGVDEAYALATEPDMDTLDTLLGEMTMDDAIADMRKTINGLPEETA